VYQLFDRLTGNRKHSDNVSPLAGKAATATTIVLAAVAALVTGELVESPLLPPPNTTHSNHRHLAALPVYLGIPESDRSRITGVAEPRPDDA
jgi:hypothetical protein